MASLLLLLLSSLWFVSLNAVTIHRTSINVDSHKSIDYRGSSISIFRHQRNPNRFFFQPLGFLDPNSIRLVDNELVNSTRLHFDVYLWTDEFLALVQSSIPECQSIELMPLREVKLSWNKQAGHFLGKSFRRLYRLLDSWQDGDKPRKRMVATIICKDREDCEKLSSTFARLSTEVFHHIFDLQYRVHVDWTRTYSLYIRSKNFEDSPIFQKAEKFSTSKSSSTTILSRESIETIIEEVYLSAIEDLEKTARRDVNDLRVADETHAFVFEFLSNLLKQDPINDITDGMWSQEVFWSGIPLLRPDRLAKLFNVLFLKHSTVNQVKVVDSLRSKMQDLSESMPEVEFTKIKSFVDRFTPSRPDIIIPISANEVEDLSFSLRSPVMWDAKSGKFLPAPKSAFFRINIVDIKRRGIFLIRNIKIHHEETVQHDPISAAFSANASETVSDDWKALLETSINKRIGAVEEMVQNFTEMYEAKVREISNVLKEELEKQGMYDPVSTRNANIRVPADGLFPETGRYITDSETKKLIVSEVQKQMVNFTASKQDFFAKDFCILSNGSRPPNMRCEILSFIMPKKSLRMSAIFDRRVRYDPGRIGDNHFMKLSNDFFSFALNICCTIT